MQYERELATALTAATNAGERLREMYEDFQVIPDAPASISTEADRQSQEIILQLLHQQFPQDALCAEEKTSTLKQAPATGTRVWIVDPIDGTRGFAQKNGEFSVMVALVDEGRIALGVVLEPAHGRLTYAVQGSGCWRRDQSSSDAVPCRVTSTTDLAAMTLTRSRSQSTKLPDQEKYGFRPAKVIPTYSAGIKLALVARGEADLYWNDYPRFYDWDTCAGHLLVVEAGGQVSGLRGEALRYGQPGALQQHGLLATNARLHDAALRVIVEHS